MNLQEIKAREQAATHGPWYHNITETSIDSETTCVVTPEIDGQEFPIIRMKNEDANFIACARTDIPELIAEVERLTAALSNAESDRDTLGMALRLSIETHSVNPRQVERLIEYYIQRAQQTHGNETQGEAEK